MNNLRLQFRLIFNRTKSASQSLVLCLTIVGHFSKNNDEFNLVLFSDNNVDCNKFYKCEINNVNYDIASDPLPNLEFCNV